MARRPSLEVDLDALMADSEALDAIVPPLAEYLRRKSHPFYHYVPDDAPDRNQLGFHKSKKQTRLLFGGNQSGKSRAAAQELAWFATGTHPYRDVPPKPKIWVVSAMYQNLDSGVYKHFREVFPDWRIVEHGGWIPDWENKMRKWHRTDTGAEITWFSAEGGRARKKFQSEAVDLLIVDEEVSETSIQELQARRLSGGAPMIVSATLVNSEPWICDYETRAESGDPDVHLTRMSTRAAARAGHVQQGTLDEWEKGLSAEDAEVRLEGMSKRMHGLVYPEFQARTHVVHRRPVERDCTRYMAIDPGWGTCAALWIAVFPDETCEAYRELYLKNKNYLQVATAIFRAEGWELEERDGKKVWTPNANTERVYRRWIDPSAYRMDTSGTKSIGWRLRKQGISPLMRADNNVDAGIDALRELWHILASEGRPRLVIQNHLQYFLHERARYKFKRPTETQDSMASKPVKREDHLMDCARYLALGGLHYMRRRQENPLQAVEQLLDDAPPGIYPTTPSVLELVRREQRQLREGTFGKEVVDGGGF